MVAMTPNFLTFSIVQYPKTILIKIYTKYGSFYFFYLELLLNYKIACVFCFSFLL